MGDIRDKQLISTDKRMVTGRTLGRLVWWIVRPEWVMIGIVGYVLNTRAELAIAAFVGGKTDCNLLAQALSRGANGVRPEFAPLPDILNSMTSRGRQAKRLALIQGVNTWHRC